jgi:hypothetical protein
LLPYTTCPPHIMPENLVLERLFSPSPKNDSFHTIASKGMSLLDVRQKVLVPLRYMRLRFARSRCYNAHLDIYLLRWLTTAVMSGRVQFELYKSFPMRVGKGNSLVFRGPSNPGLMTALAAIGVPTEVEEAIPNSSMISDKYWDWLSQRVLFSRFLSILHPSS